MVVTMTQQYFPQKPRVANECMYKINVGMGADTILYGKIKFIMLYNLMEF